MNAKERHMTVISRQVVQMNEDHIHARVTTKMRKLGSLLFLNFWVKKFLRREVNTFCQIGGNNLKLKVLCVSLPCSLNCCLHADWYYYPWIKKLNLDQLMYNPFDRCNCDKNDNVWLEDSNLLSDKTSLPVTKLTVGDFGGSLEEGYHTLSKLKCYGVSDK